MHIKLRIHKEMAYRVYDEFEEFTKMEDGSFIAEINMSENEWILYYISTFGPYCEILQPNELKNRFKNHLEKTLVGISAKTSNNSPDMGNVIGGLWENFYKEGVHEQIKNKVNEFAIGLYDNYTEDKNEYCITVGNEVLLEILKNIKMLI